jgi:hypothetical protein
LADTVAAGLITTPAEMRDMIAFLKASKAAKSKKPKKKKRKQK